MNKTTKLSRPPVIGRVFSLRFLKFGTVGLSGTFVNLAVLFVSQEFLFRAVEPADTRLTISLAMAIFVSIINNFSWNRFWTWGDRKDQIGINIVLQFGQYFLACWLAIAIQFIFTKLLANFFYYLIANLIAIGISALVNYLINDTWTFPLRKRTPQSIST